jgi:hypothetical protein
LALLWFEFRQLKTTVISPELIPASPVNSSVAMKSTQSTSPPNHEASETRGSSLSTGIDPRLAKVSTRPFVGRLGGNQAFTASRDDPNYEEVLRESPDAAGHFGWREAFDLRLFLELDLWQQAIIEGLGSCMLVFVTGATGYALAAETP